MSLRRPTAAEVVATALRKEILRGIHPPGSSLPTEVELANRFGFSRLTIREAVKTLVSHGLLQVRQGAGTTVLDFRKSGSLALLPTLLEIAQNPETGALTPEGAALLEDILLVRRILAVEIAGLACDRATPADIDELRSIAALQQERVDDDVAFAAGDIEFTRRLLRSCNSLTLELAFNTFLRVVDEIPNLVRVLLFMRREATAYYESLIDRLAARDRSGIRRLVREGLAAMDSAILEAARRGDLRWRDIDGDRS